MELCTAYANPLFMESTIRLNLTRVLEVTGELKHFLDLGAIRLQAAGQLSQEASEALIFAMADELEDHIRAMCDRQGTATIRDIRTWIRAWIDEQEAALGVKPPGNGDRG